MEACTLNRRAGHYMYSILSSTVSGIDAPSKQNGSWRCLDCIETLEGLMCSAATLRRLQLVNPEEYPQLMVSNGAMQSVADFQPQASVR